MRFANYTQLTEFLKNVNLGESIFTVDIDCSSITLKPPANPFDDLLPEDDWLCSLTRSKAKRSFNKDLGKWVVASRTYDSIRDGIYYGLMSCVKDLVDSKMPERTALYKDIKYISQRNISNTEFLDTIVQILNYYAESRTDSTCRSNTLALLEVLRKRYNGKSN